MKKRGEVANCISKGTGNVENTNGKHDPTRYSKHTRENCEIKRPFAGYPTKKLTVYGYVEGICTKGRC